MEGSQSSMKEINWIYTARKLGDLFRPKFGIYNRGTSLDKFHKMIWRLKKLFTRGYQLLKGSSFIVVDEIHRIYDRNDFVQKMDSLKKLATVCRGTQINGTCLPHPARVRGIHRIHL